MDSNICTMFLLYQLQYCLINCWQQVFPSYLLLNVQLSRNISFNPLDSKKLIKHKFINNTPLSNVLIEPLNGKIMCIV